MARFFGLLALATGLAQGQPQYRAFWADAFHAGYKNPGEVDRMIEDVVAARGNMILLEIRHRGGSYYLKSLEPPVEDATYTQGFDALQYLIERAHARGIEVHAWYPVTPLWPFARAPIDPRHVWHAHGPHAPGPDMWMTVSSAGRVSTSVDPGHPDVLQYLADVILEPARHYDLDGLHLDYIRYPEDANYGWNPAAVERFQRLENRAGNPLAGDARWSEFRRRQVTQLVRQIYLRLQSIRPQAKLSAALITWGNGPASDAEFRSKDAYSRVFQDWRGWLEEGILDLGIPMNYFRDQTNRAFFDRWNEYEKDRQYNRGVLIGPAIYLNSVPESMAQLG
ncbi:MAG: glycoside hydrolase family 10 protein, partial [Bryobacteraceae bacterium]